MNKQILTFMKALAPVSMTEDSFHDYLPKVYSCSAFRSAFLKSSTIFRWMGFETDFKNYNNFITKS